MWTVARCVQWRGSCIHLRSHAAPCSPMQSCATKHCPVLVLSVEENAHKSHPMQYCAVPCSTIHSHAVLCSPMNTVILLFSSS